MLRYVRIEFSGGEVFYLENSANALELNGVGRGTVVDHVQAHRTFDDCFEWFGGTVRAKYLVATNGRDDAFDWQVG